jgi:hypothetical protein
MAAWLEALHEHFSTGLKVIEGAFNEFRDGFITLETPTREQAACYRKTEHRHRIMVGTIVSYLRELEWGLQAIRKGKTDGQ